MADERQVVREVVIRSTPELAFEALTKASELREWLCDEARCEPRLGGRFEVRWNSGYHAEGRFMAVEAPRRAVYSWLGTEPAATTVEATIEPLPEGVRVRLVHSGFGAGTDWDKALSDSEEGWTEGMENLTAVLETGIDLRLARRPFVGIHLDNLDARRAKAEGIAADRGIYLTAIVEGSPAEAGGLKRGDVIVSFAGVETPTYDELTPLLGTHRAGDQVTVEIVRGPDRQTVQIVLGSRPATVVPGSPEELAEQAAEIYREVDAALRVALEGVSDDEAELHPAEGEWSAKETLAHLSIVERDQQC